jgi:hypothetical protein
MQPPLSNNTPWPWQPCRAFPTTGVLIQTVWDGIVHSRLRLSRLCLVLLKTSQPNISISRVSVLNSAANTLPVWADSAMARQPNPSTTGVPKRAR